jgi:putative aminopeptidase FrvX
LPGRHPRHRHPRHRSQQTRQRQTRRWPHRFPRHREPSVQRLIDTAAKAKLAIQHEASSRFTGTDTDKIFHSREGIPSALVSLPLRCMHSVVETAHLDDVQHTIDLLTDFVLSLSEKDEFRQVLK